MAGLFAKAISRPRRAIRSTGETPEFYDEAALNKELERVFDICHGCRRCFSLCQSFPTLFDLVDNAESREVDGVAKSDYPKVVDQCYLCDLCYMTKCPYVPPHAWNLDFPHLMLRAKAVAFRKGETKLRDKILTSTDAMGAIAANPVIARPSMRSTRRSRAGAGKDARGRRRGLVPPYQPNRPLRRRVFARCSGRARGTHDGQGRAVHDLLHAIATSPDRRGSGRRLRAQRHPVTSPRRKNAAACPSSNWATSRRSGAPRTSTSRCSRGWSTRASTSTALVPSCVLMFKQELPLMFPDDADVQKVKAAFFDPFEYLTLRHKARAS